MGAVAVDNALLMGDDGPPVRSADGVSAHFYLRAVRDEEKSAVEGRPVHVEREYVEIHTPGDKTSTVDRPVRPEDVKRFPAAYAAFKSGQKEQLTGTPLSEVTWVSKAQAMDLAHFNVRTVDQLAELSDGNLHNVGPIRALRDMARAYMDKAKGAAPLAKLAKDLADKDKALATLQAEMAELKKALAEQRKEK